MTTSIIKIITLFLLVILFQVKMYAQENEQKVRLAKLVINPDKLEAYKVALTEEIETSVRVESGVLTLYAVFEREHPNHITILEIYADEAAYQSHLQTAHFLKYKKETMDMVQSLELVESVPLIPEMKIK